MSLDPGQLVRAKNLSKKFYALSPSGRSAALSDIVLETLLFKPSLRHAPSAFTWPLKNVSFEISRGESVLLTGLERSGKTPIFNLLCGLYEPDEGTLELNGKISILSSNATLFHPRRSILENCFLMASVFGLSKTDTQKKLDSIFELSGPLPPDSSTMGLLSHHEIWMRLAVSIFLHAELDLYLLDETMLGGSPEYLARIGHKLKEIKIKGGSIFTITHEPQNLKNYFDRTLRIEGGVLTEVSV